MVTLWSGIHTGAESPSFPSNLKMGLSWSRVMKVAFLLLYSSMALLRASSQSFLSCTFLKTDPVNQPCQCPPVIPGSQSAAPHVTGYAKFILEILCCRNMYVQLVQWDGVAHFQAGRVARPATVIGGIKKTVTKKDKVSGSDSFPGDLLQLSLLKQLPSWSDEFPVPETGLKFQHCLKFILKRKYDYMNWNE